MIQEQEAAKAKFTKLKAEIDAEIATAKAKVKRCITAESKQRPRQFASEVMRSSRILHSLYRLSLYHKLFAFLCQRRVKKDTVSALRPTLR